MLLKSFEKQSLAVSMYGKVVEGLVHYLVLFGDTPYTFDDYVEADIFFTEAVEGLPNGTTVLVH